MKAITLILVAALTAPAYAWDNTPPSTQQAFDLRYEQQRQPVYTPPSTQQAFDLRYNPQPTYAPPPVYRTPTYDAPRQQYNRQVPTYQQQRR